jgi:hypothetical protein
MFILLNLLSEDVLEATGHLFQEVLKWKHFQITTRTGRENLPWDN